MIDGFNFDNPIDQALQKQDLKSFELLYKYCSDNDNTTLVYMTVMRNLKMIMEQPTLNKTMASFFNDDREYGNAVTIGLRLGHESLPNYS